jgi:hypothetical protein
MFLMLMALPLNSQITLKKGQVKAFVSDNGDTLIAMRIEDAKFILTDILNYQIADSIISEYEAKDKETSKVITLQKNAILKLSNQLANDEARIAALESVIKNKNEEIVFKDDVIKKQKKEIRKQKVLKIIGFSGAIILPVITALLLLN